VQKKKEVIGFQVGLYGVWLKLMCENFRISPKTSSKQITTQN